MKPTPEDYAIDPNEAMEINSKATQEKLIAWVYRGSPSGPPDHGGIINLPVVQLQRSWAFTPEDARAIAYNHNNTPGLARRLIELESFILSLDMKCLEHYERCFAEAVKDRIKKGREDAKANG